jgi:hypothetical protein
MRYADKPGYALVEKRSLGLQPEEVSILGVKYWI